MLTKMVHVMDDHDFKGLKHGAKYILGHDTDTVTRRGLTGHGPPTVDTGTT